MQQERHFVPCPEPFILLYYTVVYRRNELSKYTALIRRLLIFLCLSIYVPFYVSVSVRFCGGVGGYKPCQWHVS